MILSLETFNGFLKFKRCKLESVEDALDLVTKGCYFGSIERCFLYHPYSWKLPKISETVLEGRILSIYCPYQWIFTSSKSLYKCFDSSIQIYKVKGTFVRKIYWWLTAPGRDFRDLFKIIRATVVVLRELGFTIPPEKSVLLPSQQTVFAAFVIKSFKVTIILTEQRKQSIYTFCKNILSCY